MERFSDFIRTVSDRKKIFFFTDDMKLRLQVVLNLIDAEPLESIVDFNGNPAVVLTWNLDDDQKVEVMYDRSNLSLISINYYGDAFVGMKLFNSRALMKILDTDEQTLYLSTRQSNPIEVRNAIRYTFV